MKFDQHRLVRRSPVLSWGIAGLCLGALLCGGCSASQEQVKKAQGHVGEGVAVFKTDQQSAYVFFQKALKEDPKNRDAHYYIALIYAMQEKFQQAEAEIREVLDIDPDYPEAYNFLGQVFVKQNQRQDAIRAFRKAVGYPLYSTPDVAYYQLGLVLELEGDMQGAMQAFEDALKVTPSNVPQALVYLEVGRVHYKMGQDSKARDALARAVSLDRDKSGAVSAEAKALLERLKL
ncbi:MAG TPA: tetratricopeptide repeat protein [Nitrospiraceae bacterium]|nr:tetratricopeptide repeat protein [Nitrospiraceae bacterium]